MAQTVVVALDSARSRNRRAEHAPPLIKQHSSFQGNAMSVDVTAIIRKEPKADPRTGSRSFYASLALFSEDATEYGPPRLFDTFEEVAKLLQMHAGVTYENLRDGFRRYET